MSSDGTLGILGSLLGAIFAPELLPMIGLGGIGGVATTALGAGLGNLVATGNPMSALEAGAMGGLGGAVMGNVGGIFGGGASGAGAAGSIASAVPGAISDGGSAALGGAASDVLGGAVTPGVVSGAATGAANAIPAAAMAGDPVALTSAAAQIGSGGAAAGAAGGGLGGLLNSKTLLPLLLMGGAGLSALGTKTSGFPSPTSGTLTTNAAGIPGLARTYNAAGTAGYNGTTPQPTFFIPTANASANGYSPMGYAGGGMIHTPKPHIASVSTPKPIMAGGGVPGNPNMDGSNAHLLAHLIGMHRPLPPHDLTSNFAQGGSVPAPNPVAAMLSGAAMGGASTASTPPMDPSVIDGPGDGSSDSVPAQIDGQTPAALSSGEFVIPADAVAHIGNGSSQAGARKLQAMVHAARTAKTGSPTLPKRVKLSKSMQMAGL